jgi:peptide deformylase
MDSRLRGNDEMKRENVMTVLQIIIAPDPRLKTKSQPVAAVDDAIRSFVADLFDTMYAQKGIGLAAVQVGVLKRILVADVTWREEDGKPGVQHVLINPEIVSASDVDKVYKEGCLSFPEQYSDVTRPDSLRVRYLDLDGKTQENEFDGLLGICIQHEIDHLNGVTFVDHISSVKRDMILRKLTKQKKAGYFDPHVHDEHCNHG